MKIIVLDGYTLNPGDLSWQMLKNLGDVKIFDRTSESEILDRCKDSEIILTNKVVLDKNIISQLPKIKYIGVLATGYNVVDMEEASANGIVVTNIPAYGTSSVAQHTFALILELMEHLSAHIKSVKEGYWLKQSDFSYTTGTTHELSGKTLGILGYGRIAKQVIKIARSFDMHILVYTSHPDNNNDVTFVRKDELFTKSDIISIHTSLRADNEKIVNSKTLDLMKPASVLINTSRGGMIDEANLAKFLNNEKIAGAALDVLSEEPPKSNNPLLKAKNCRITPHIAWSTYEARQRLMDHAINNIQAFLKGHPVNVVN